MLKNSKIGAWNVNFMLHTGDLFQWISPEDLQKMDGLKKSGNLKDWILAWSSVKPNELEINEETSIGTFHAVKRVAVELLLQMRNSSCQERNFSISASSDHQAKYLSKTFEAITIKTFAKNEIIFQDHPIHEQYKRHWLSKKS